MASRVAVTILGVILLAGCTRTTLKSTVVGEHPGRDETTELDFWDGLAESRLVSNSDALHALFLSFTQDDPETYDARLELARKRGWFDSERAIPERESAEIGWIARAIYIESGLEGGVTIRLVGVRERYAVKELNHRDWLPEMSKNQAVSGLQLISVLSSAEDHLAGES